MKSYTDLEQSKKLAEFLPLESSDMYWDLLSKSNYAKVNNIGCCLGRTCIYAWSLAALLNVIGDKFKYDFTYNGKSFILTVGDFENLNKNLIDACVAIIEKLHELKML